MAKKSKSSFIKKAVIAFILLIVILGGAAAYFGYSWIYVSNVKLKDQKSEFIYIPTGSTFNDVVNILTEENILKNQATFQWVAEKKQYKTNVKPGRYRIKKGMSNNELVNILKAGLQEPVTFTLNEVRTKEHLASRVGGKLEADSTDLVNMLEDEVFTDRFGFTPQNIMAMFIPGNFKLNWNTSARSFVDTCAQQYKRTWNEARVAKAEQIGLTQSEVAILASIVQRETRLKKEMPMIAGVYMNRLRKGMPLQADPTLIFATGDFGANRVLNTHKAVDSPYNTYKNAGLPPGPIDLAKIEAIDAVLNYNHHSYLYFCAKEDFSGGSNFAKTYPEHQKNAAKYQRELNRRNIRK